MFTNLVTSWQALWCFIVVLAYSMFLYFCNKSSIEELKTKLNVLDDRQRSDNDKQFNNYFNLDGLIKNHRHEKVMEEVPSKVVEMKEVDRVVW